MSLYRFDESVASDLEAIWDYIAADDIDAADRWIELLFSAFESLARNPGMGHARQIWHITLSCSGLWART